MVSISSAGTIAQHTLDPLYELTGPVVSVYLRLAPGAGDQGSETMLRWRALRADLVTRGAAEADLAVIDAIVSEQPSGDRVLAVFATGGQLIAVYDLERSDEADQAVIGRWPRTEPLMHWRQQRLSCATALVDRTGAELAAYDAGGRLVRTETVEGPDDEIERNAPGGWAQARYRRRAEDSWAHNARAVAERLSGLASDVGAQAVVVAGDGRAVDLVIEALPERIQPQVIRVDADGLRSKRHRALTPDLFESALQAEAAQARSALVGSFDEAVAGARAVEGPADVRNALDRGIVRELVLVHGEVPAELADALIAAAVAEGSDVMVVSPDELTLVGGVGATLRF